MHNMLYDGLADAGAARVAGTLLIALIAPGEVFVVGSRLAPRDPADLHGNADTAGIYLPNQNAEMLTSDIALLPSVRCMDAMEWHEASLPTCDIRLIPGKYSF